MTLPPADRSTYPLAGVRILDLTRLLPGGFCTLLLADLGADVVKVEDPHRGDYSRAMAPLIELAEAPGAVGAVFAALNRGKRAVALDLKADLDRALFEELVDQADVVVESFRPGVMDRLGVGATTLCGRNPRLVYCALTGYGQSGPLASAVGHDINYIGTVGLLDLNGLQGGPPVVPGAQIADLSGALVAALGVVAALLRRSTTGRGGLVDTSMAEAAFAFLSLPWAEWAATGRDLGRGAHILSGGYACYNVYAASDGRHLALGALEPKFWAAFCRAVDHPEWIEQHLDPAAQPALRTSVAALLAERSADAWLALVDGCDVPLTLVHSLGEVSGDEQLRARGVFFQAGAVLGARTPVRLDGLPPAAVGRYPGHGEHRPADLLNEWKLASSKEVSDG